MLRLYGFSGRFGLSAPLVFEVSVGGRGGIQARGVILGAAGLIRPSSRFVIRPPFVWVVTLEGNPGQKKK